MRASVTKLWEKMNVRRKGHVLLRQIEEILRRVDAMPTLDTRSADEILGYDEHGLPRSRHPLDL